MGFAFAGADFLMEIDSQGRVVFTSGATRFFTGRDDKSLQGTDLKALFADDDVPLVATMCSNAKAALKQGPYLVSIRHVDNLENKARVFISSFSFENNGSLYMAVSKSDSLLRVMGFEHESTYQKTISSAQEFENQIEKRIPELIARGKDIDLKLVQLDGLEGQKSKVGNESWQSFIADIGQVVLDASLDGEMAARLEDGKYVLVQGRGIEEGEDIEKKIIDIATFYNLGDAIDLKTKTIEGNLPSLSAREASRAILYTINRMEKSGIETCDDDLKKSFASFLSENTAKIKNLKKVISHQLFQICFQPIVDLRTRRVVHHEVLTRFDEDSSPYEMIVLCEDIGIAPDMDLSVCRQTLKYADMHRKKNIGPLAVNLSGASIQNEAFFEALTGTLNQYSDAASHIMFEITESSSIGNLDLVDKFIQTLREMGHQVCLDDFGAGAASFQYLHKLHVDGVKIDGAYTKTVLTSPRDATMIKNLTQMCHELDIFVVSEMIETEKQAEYLRDIGVDKGQGWLFGKPQKDTVSIL